MGGRITSADALQLLGLAPAASPNEIRRAYRKLALLWHPDRHALNPQRRKHAEERFKGISAAYQHLKEFGSHDGRSPEPPPPPRPSRPANPHYTQGPPRPPRLPARAPAALPEAPWWVRPVSLRTVFVVYALMRVGACIKEQTYRLTEAPPIPEITEHRIVRQSAFDRQTT